MEESRAEYGSDYEQPTSVPMITAAYNLPAKNVIDSKKWTYTRIRAGIGRLLYKCFKYVSGK